MTLPTVVNNIYNRQLEAALKKNASVIEQALNMYQAENGMRVTCDIGFHNLKPAIIKYFNVLKDCGYGTEVGSCIENNVSATSYNTYKNFTGTNSIYLNLFDDGQFVLTDGCIIFINNINDSRTYISVDVNGYNKGPNRLGQDLFMFQIDNKGKLLPMGAEGTTYYSETDEYCSKTSNNINNGAGCTYKALTSPAFWKSLP